MRARGLRLLIILAGFLTCACRGDEPTPVSSPGPAEDWLVFAVACGSPGCPGLTAAQIDRSFTPARARLRVGQQTSLRAVAVQGCPAFQLTLDVRNWTASDPAVVKVEASSFESAIVTALAPGISSVRAQRFRPDGVVSEGGLRDSIQNPSEVTGCATRRELRIEVVP